MYFNTISSALCLPIELQKLDMSDMMGSVAFVTDVTGYLVLLRMESLQILNMGQSKVIKSSHQFAMHNFLSLYLPCLP